LDAVEAQFYFIFQISSRQNSIIMMLASEMHDGKTPDIEFSEKVH
jgi:hypothetical protein